MRISWRSIGFSFLVLTRTCIGGSYLFAAPPAASCDCTAAEQLLTEAARVDCGMNAGCRAWLRHKFVRECDLEKYGLRLDGESRQCDATRPVVVVVHGFNSSPLQNAAIMRPIRDAGFACGTFAYPNDYLIRHSATLLSQELRRFAKLFPERRVILICHSMGGLVARACIEDAKLDPGNVSRLVMIAPPTHGTIIAQFAVGSDLWEHWLARKEGWPLERIRDSVVDGLGEAGGELCPQSDFLHELNSRLRNPKTRYTLLLGTGARLSESQVEWIRDSVCRSMEKIPGGCRTAEELEALLADVDELVEGKGDGVVAVKRGRLDGVSDTLVMPFGHIAVTGEPKTDLLREVQHVVLARVQ